MNEKEKSKILALAMGVFLLLFYIAIVMYIFFVILHINVLSNFITGMSFELIGFVILGAVIFGNIVSKPLKIGCYIPLVIITVVYTILLDVINIFGITSISSLIFALIHFALLFMYCLISIPMYIIGRI